MTEEVVKCQICGHPTFRVTVHQICSDEDCDGAPNKHRHCGYENEHGICTTVGCMPERTGS